MLPVLALALGIALPDTPACALAHIAPTDANIVACTGQPIDLRPRTFAYLATLYTADGPVIFILDDGLTGPDCIARMEAGITPADVLAVIDERILPAGEGHVPASPHQLDITAAVPSCEFSW